MTNHRSTWLRSLALCVVAASLVVACSSGARSTSSRLPDVRAEVVAVPDCEGAWSDLTDLSPTRKVARCLPGAPTPKPLSQPTNLVVSIPFKLEFAAPVLLADSMGEFAKENLTISVVALPGFDAIPQLAQGQLDVAVGGFEVAFFNGARMGLPVKAVMGNYYPPFAGDYSVPQTGLWCRRASFTDPADPDPAETQDMLWASSTGKATVSFFYAVEELRKRVPDFDPERVRTVVIPASESPIALKNGAADCAFLIDPLWTGFTGPEYVQMATQVPSEPLGCVLFGKNLLRDSPAVGDAFVRAVVRTINTYLRGDYHQDPIVANQLARDMNQPNTDFMRRTPSLTFDWELRSVSTRRIQDLFIDLNVISTYERPIADERLVDRSFTDRAVGRTG